MTELYGRERVGERERESEKAGMNCEDKTGHKNKKRQTLDLKE